MTNPIRPEVLGEPASDERSPKLDNGVKGTKWFRLIDRVYSPRNLQSAFWAVWRKEGSPGVDRQTVEQFAAQQAQELGQLSQPLHERTYRPHPARRVWINKLGSREKRPLGGPHQGKNARCDQKRAASAGARDSAPLRSAPRGQRSQKGKNLTEI